MTSDFDQILTRSLQISASAISGHALSEISGQPGQDTRVPMDSTEEPRSTGGAPSPIRCDEATWRTRDLKKAVESLGREFLAREITLGSSISQRMAKTLKTVQTTHASLGKAHEQLRGLTTKIASAKQVAANKLL